jgi:hypothetical protein
MGCVGLKKERTKTELPVINDTDTAIKAMHYVQIDEEIKALETEKESLREALTGITGLTATGYEIRWSTAQSNTVDKEAVEKALGFVPTKQGKESTRLSVKKTGGK